MNWLIARGFDRYGYSDLATNIREKSVSAIEKYCDKYGVLFEFFDDRDEIDPPALLRKGKCAPEASPFNQVIHDFGWSAALYLDMVLHSAWRLSC